VEKMKKRNEYRVWVGKSARLERRCKNNSKMYPKTRTEWSVLDSSAPGQGQSAGLL
jgi:hypothetical protein